MTKVTNINVKALLKQPGRHTVGDGLHLKVLDENRAYWVYRYRANGKERETSVGSARKLSLPEARTRHLELRKAVKVDRKDPLVEKRAAKRAAAQAPESAKPTFGALADRYVATHEAGWKNAKHRYQWRMTLAHYCAPIRDLPVDRIDTEAVLKVLEPLWTTVPETASRLRGRIEAVLDAARALGHVDENRANPARWKGHLALLLPKRRKLASRGHHKALPYRDLPTVIARLSAEDWRRREGGPVRSADRRADRRGLGRAMVGGRS
jgi:hypothetical protein